MMNSQWSTRPTLPIRWTFRVEFSSRKSNVGCEINFLRPLFSSLGRCLGAGYPSPHDFFGFPTEHPSLIRFMATVDPATLG